MTEHEALTKIHELIDRYWGADLMRYTNSENTAEAGAAKLCCEINETINVAVGKLLKYKIGDRIKYRNKGSNNDGRLGLVIGVSDNAAQFSYCVSLDATETQSDRIFWTCEDVLEPYVEEFSDSRFVDRKFKVGERKCLKND